VKTPLPFGRRFSTQFLVFPISTRVDITVYQHGKCFIFVKCKTQQNGDHADSAILNNGNVGIVALQTAEESGSDYGGNGQWW
jgi:hypothetical protein